MQRYKRLLFGAGILLGAAVAMILWVEARTLRSPLSVGSTADEAWTYIHSPASRGSHGAFFTVTRQGWTAHAHDIQCEVRYFVYWRTNYLFATRHLVYLLGTNGTIVGTKSDWKLIRPF